MKRLVSIFISLVVVCCLSSTVMAADFYKDTGLAQYTFSVPSTLRPGNSGWVSIEGTWPEYVKVVVSARDTVKLKNVDTGEIEYLDVDFGGLSLVGNGSEVVSASNSIEIGDFDMRFGKWSGSVSYSVDVIEMTILNVDANGGEVVGAADTVIKYGEVISGEEMSLPADMLYREGYELVGFSEDPYATEGDFNYLIPDRTGSITLYAVWSELEPAEPIENTVYSIEDDTEIIDMVDNGSTEPTCICGTGTEAHLDGCPLYVVPTSNEDMIVPIEGDNEDNTDNGIPEENNDSVGSEGENIESVEETEDIEQEDIDSDPTVEDSGDNEIPEEAPAEGAPLEGENEIDIE